MRHLTFIEPIQLHITLQTWPQWTVLLDLPKAVRRGQSTVDGEPFVGVSKVRQVELSAGTTPSIATARIYDRYAYDKEKRDALECWARRLQAIVECKIRKIVQIAG